MRSNFLAWCFWFLTTVLLTSARIHKLEIRKDTRRLIPLSTFGFYKGGLLNVNLTNFKADSFGEGNVFGFSLYRMLSYSIHPFFDRESCLLPQDVINIDQNRDENPAIHFTMDLKNLLLRVNCSENVHSVHIYKDSDMLFVYRSKRNSLPARFTDTILFPRKKRDVMPHDAEKSAAADDDPGSKTKGNICSHIKLPITLDKIKGENYYHTNFAMYVASPEEEGLYKLYFYNCPARASNDESQAPLDFTVQILEINSGNFLSAGEMPLPALYFMMALLFFLSGCFWVFILKKSRHPVFKIHYLMAVLVYLKSLSLMFHGINYHFIQTKGEHIAAWAILYYITHLLKGAVLFITIVLIGTGWNFIKHILADKEKKLFVIIIPLQVLANVAEIVIEESEKGDIERRTWGHVFTLVDLLCCGIIIVPVVWSKRHLEQAADTDGKAAINLRKLKLFKYFYVMIFCYIYFTRVILDLLKKIVPFQYEWLEEMSREMATFVFFVLTGYKFRPASANPYFAVSSEETIEANDDDDEMDVVLFSSVSGGSEVTEGLSKVNKTTKTTATELPSTQEERDGLLNKRESSHEYD